MHTCIAIPRSSLPKRKKLPWLSKQIIQLMRKRNMYFTKSKSSPSYASRYKVLRNTVISKLRSARSDYFRALKPSNKSFWKAVSSLNRGNSRIPTLVSEAGEEASAPASKAVLLNNQFVKNFNSSIPPLSKEDLPRLPLHSDDSLFCSEDKIFDMLSHLDVSKAAGPDGISARMLKETATSISAMITTIFNMSISTGVLPDQWKKSLVPIPKSGDSSNPAS